MMQAHLYARHVCLLLPSGSSHGRRHASSIPFVRPTRHFHLIKLDSKGEREEESAGVDGDSGGRRDSLSSLVIIQFPCALVCCEIELGIDFVFSLLFIRLIHHQRNCFEILLSAKQI